LLHALQPGPGRALSDTLPPYLPRSLGDHD